MVLLAYIICSNVVLLDLPIYFRYDVTDSKHMFQLLLLMGCVSVRIKFLLGHHKKGKKRREEKIGLSSNTMEEELDQI
jgi:hypothetical protein